MHAFYALAYELLSSIQSTKVTFNTPLASRGLSSNVKAPEPKKQATTLHEKSKLVEMEGVESLSQDENVPDPFSEGVRGDGEGVRSVSDIVSGDSEAIKVDSSEAVRTMDQGQQLQVLIEQQQTLLEQAAMVGIGKCTYMYIQLYACVCVCVCV